MNAKRGFLFLALMLAWTVPAAAQFTQYTPPGGVSKLGQGNLREELDEAVRSARWRLGRLFVDPWFEVKEFGYDDNVGNRPDTAPDIVSDYSATVGAGLRGYVPFGETGIFAVHALPEYVWWEELAERRRTNGRYGVGYFTAGGPVEFGLSGTIVDDTRFFSREFEDRVNVRDERVAASVQIGLGRGYSLFVQGSKISYDFDADLDISVNLSAADREEALTRVGLRHEFGGGVSIDLGIESSDVEFSEATSARNNSGDAPFLEVALDRDDISGYLSLAARDLRFEDPALDYDETTGRGWFAWSFVDSLELQLFANSGLVYSFTENYAHFEDRSAGVGLAWRAGGFSVRVFTEEGTNDYTALDSSVTPRMEDLEAVGGRIEYKVGRVTTTVGASSTEYTSSIPNLGRTVDTIWFNLAVGSGSDSPWG